MSKAILKLLRAGLWAPLLVMAVHLCVKTAIPEYMTWPAGDIPRHLFGGMAIGYFVTGSLRMLPREHAPSTRQAILELLLIVCIGATMAVFLEFTEFTFNRLFDNYGRHSLGNTMQDLGVGISGALAWAIIRARQLRIGVREVVQLGAQWVNGA